MKARSFRWILPLSTSLACLSFVSCKSTKTGYEDVVDYTTPKTNLSESEYPFDEKGNYLADVVSGKKKGKTKTETKVDSYVEKYETPTVSSIATTTKTTTTSANYELPPEPSPAFASSSSGGGTSTIYSTSPAEKPRVTTASKPKTSSSSSSAKSKPKVAASKPKPKPAPKPSSLAYTIKKGDTLYGLASRYGTSVAAIKKTNGLSSDFLRDGKTIRIPKK